MITAPPLKKFGATSMQWTPVGLGSWAMERDPKASITALQAGLDAGANHIDTAEMYGDGRAEEIVGEAVRGRRDKIFLVSKVLPSNASYDGTLAACHRSLTRLKTDHLDVYLLQWREHPTDHAETFRAFEKLKADGKISAWGVSNFDVDDMVEAVKVAGEGKIACNQVLYHLEERAIEPELIPWCDAHGVAITAYSPLGKAARPNSARSTRSPRRAAPLPSRSHWPF
jgi:diketogulonate reductase-like aldo/keto reductase